MLWKYHTNANARLIYRHDLRNLIGYVHVLLKVDKHLDKFMLPCSVAVPDADIHELTPYSG